MNKDKEGQSTISSIEVDKKRILPPSILNSDRFLQCLESVIKFFSKKLLEKEVSFSDPSTVIADLRQKDVNID